MISNQNIVRVSLTVVSVLVLGLMVYINIHAMQRDVASEIQNSGFYRMLEQSTDSESSTQTGSSGLNAKDRKSIDAMEKTVSEMTAAVEELRDKFASLANKKKNAPLRSPDLQSNSNGTKVNEPRVETPASTPPKSSANRTGLNILLLYADDWTYHTLSSYHKTDRPNTVLKTPILDALATDGIRFTHNCVTTSVCWVSRATLYTGQYMSRHKTTSPCCWSGGDKPKEKLKEAPSNWKELSFYEILARNGYHVGHAGKWGVYLPWDKNVDFNIEEDGWHLRKIGKKVWHITEKNEADALRFLVTRPRDKPFLLNVAFYATHAKDGDKRQYMPQESSMEWYEDDTIPIPPTGTEEAWKKMPYFFDERNEGRARWHWRYDNYTKHQMMMKNYYRMATEVDAACGAILEELRRQGELDNTVIIFTTDNGNYHSEHGLADKWYPHQESIRVPLIIRDPRMDDARRGSTNDEFTLNIDLAPTILGAAGIAAPPKMMGRDISPLYLAPESTKWRHEWFYEHPVISHKEYIPGSEALVRKDFKYMYWPDFKFAQLFDLRADPGEMEDVINSTDPEIAAIREEMKQRFAELKGLIRSDTIVTL